jgi:hypothetical protein
MSFPFYNIFCTACDYKDRYSFGANYSYEGSLEHQPILAVGWCGECDKIVHAVAPFTEDDERQRIDDQELWIRHNRKGFFSRFSKKAKREIEEAEQEILLLSQRTSYFKNQEYQTRCLRCSTSKVSLFPLPYNEYNEVSEPDVRHKCGGSLRISMEGRFYYTSRPKVVYGAQGEILLDERSC